MHDLQQDLHKCLGLKPVGIVVTLHQEDLPPAIPSTVGEYIEIDSVQVGWKLLNELTEKLLG